MASYRGPPPSLSGWPFHVSDRSPILEIDPTEMVQRTCPHLFDPGQPPTHFTPSAISTRKMTAPCHRRCSPASRASSTNFRQRPDLLSQRVRGREVVRRPGRPI